ncbi:MAG: S9 family peptidase [Bacteroidota bacterium]
MTQHIPLEDFFRNPEKTGFQISPNGTHYSFTAPYEKRMNIYVQEIGSNAITQLTFETARDVSGYFWANDKRILFLKDSGGDENFQLFGVDIDGKNLKGLTAVDGVRTQIIDPLNEIEDEMIVGMNQRNPQVFDPYRLNINSGELIMLAENPGNISSWMTDHDGKLRVASATDGVNTSLLYREEESEDFKTILETNYTETLSPVFFTFDNKKLYTMSNLGRDKISISIFNPQTIKEEEIIYSNEDYDIGGLFYSEKDKKLTSASYTSWKRQRYFFDQSTKEKFDFLENSLPDVEFGITGSTKDEDKMIVRTYSDRTLGAYYYFDWSAKKLEKIHEVSPWIEKEHMANMVPISYQSRDGLKIEGYLTLPLGQTMESAAQLPVVVNPHGGPWARDNWGFNPEVQFLANRGYAVLQMNFRGSTGFGKEFWKASFNQWGLKMQDDITDGVNWLVKKGIADPTRIAIYGASYGGYATLAGLTYTPKLYACGIDYVGVSNLFTFMESIPPYWKPYQEMLYDMVGHPENDKERMTAMSPSLNADKIVSPLFIAQGANDPRVVKSESDQMVEAMKERGVHVQYMVKDNEGHGFRNEENQFEFYRAMENFLSEHMN